MTGDGEVIRIPDQRHPRHPLEPRVPMRELEQLPDPLGPLRRPIRHDARPRPERLAQAPIEIAPDKEHEHERPRIPYAALNKPNTTAEAASLTNLAQAAG